MTSFQSRHPHGISLKFAVINAAGAGDNTIVTAVEERRIKVVGFCLQSSGTINALKFKDSAGNDITGPFTFQAREGIAPAAPFPSWLFATAQGAALQLNLSDAVSVVGFVTYFDDDAE